MILLFVESLKCVTNIWSFFFFRHGLLTPKRIFVSPYMENLLWPFLILVVLLFLFDFASGVVRSLDLPQARYCVFLQLHIYWNLSHQSQSKWRSTTIKWNKLTSLLYAICSILTMVNTLAFDVTLLSISIWIFVVFKKVYIQLKSQTNYTDDDNRHLLRVRIIFCLEFVFWPSYQYTSIKMYRFQQSYCGVLSFWY